MRYPANQAEDCQKQLYERERDCVGGNCGSWTAWNSYSNCTETPLLNAKSPIKSLTEKPTTHPTATGAAMDTDASFQTRVRYKSNAPGQNMQCSEQVQTSTDGITWDPDSSYTHETCNELQVQRVGKKTPSKGCHLIEQARTRSCAGGHCGNYTPWSPNLDGYTDCTVTTTPSPPPPVTTTDGVKMVAETLVSPLETVICGDPFLSALASNFGVNCSSNRRQSLFPYKPSKSVKYVQPTKQLVSKQLVSKQLVSKQNVYKDVVFVSRDDENNFKQKEINKGNKYNDKAIRLITKLHDNGNF